MFNMCIRAVTTCSVKLSYYFEIQFLDTKSYRKPVWLIWRGLIMSPKVKMFHSISGMTTLYSTGKCKA